MSHRQSCSAGYGEADLGAPLGGSMPGYFQDRKAEGVLDPPRAKAVCLRVDATECALVALDLIGLGAREVAVCREKVAKATGIPKAHVWIHATHSHTGPMVPKVFTSDAESIYPDLYPGMVDAAWIEQLSTRVSDAARSARGAVREGPVELAQGGAAGVAFYRRFRMKDGTVRTNPGRANPNIGEPAGQVDPTLTILRFPVAQTLVVIFGLHPDTVSGKRYSADYPGHLTARVRELMGKTWNALFLNAACGNINHIDVSNPNQKSGPEESARIGRALGDAVVSSLKGAQLLEVDVLALASRTVVSRLRAVPPEVVKEAERLLRDEPAKAQDFNGLFAPAALVLGKTQEREQTAEISALRLGPVGLAAMPGEIFVELARQVAHDSPFDPTRVIGLTNGALGYIPHAAAYAEGGYESGYRSARFEPNTGEAWAKAASDLLRRLVKP
jgi:hypothetical protein